MKRLLVIIGILSLLLTGNSLAGKEKPKGNEKQQGPAPSESAYEHASDNAKFKRPADGVSVKHQSKDADEQQDRNEKGDKKAEQERHREQVENQNRNDDNGAVDSGEEGKNNKMKKTAGEGKMSSGHVDKQKGSQADKPHEMEPEQENEVQY